MSHTPEPWTIGKSSGGAKNHAICADWRIIAHVNGNGYPAGIGWSPESEADALRIVACVNACKGISTEALEKGIVSDLLGAMKNLIASAVPGMNWTDETGQLILTESRAALAKATKKVSV